MADNTSLVILLRKPSEIDGDGTDSGTGTDGKKISGSGGTSDELWLNLKEVPYSQDADYDPCADNGGEGYVTRIRVTYPPGLNYRLVTSYGTLGAKTRGETQFSDSMDFNLGTQRDTGALLGDDTTFEWEGTIYDDEGNVVSPDDVVTDHDGSEVYAYIPGETEEDNAGIVGTTRVTGTQTYDEYTLTITARGESQQDAADEQGDFTATVRAFWEGRVTTLTVRPPDGSTCKRRYRFNPDDDDDSKDTGCYKLKIKLNKCTGKLEDEILTAVPCPEDSGN